MQIKVTVTDRHLTSRIRINGSQALTRRGRRRKRRRTQTAWRWGRCTGEREEEEGKGVWAGGRAVGERGKGAREEGGMRGRC